MRKRIQTSFVPFVLLVAVCCLLLVMTIATSAAAQSTWTPDAIRVASWNIGDLTDGSGEDARIMAEHLKLLRIDILALNHIDGDQERRNQQLEAIFAQASERDGNNWDYRLFPNRNLSDRSDLVGVAWNRERVTLESDVFRPALDEGALWQKPPSAAKFSAGPGLTDVVVMPVQLERKDRQAECLAGTRGDEASDLAGHVRAAKTYFDDDDIVVVGDTDCIRDDAGQREVFSTERMLEFETSNVDAFASGRAAYERVMVPSDQPEFRRTTWYSILEAESQKTERPFSDHFLLLALIEVEPDDD